MFKVGDDVLLYVNRKVFKIDHIYKKAVWLDSGKDSLDVVNIDDIDRIATPEEIAAGHRIDKCKCVATRTYENSTCNKCGLQDTDDDSNFEYHVSPLCKIEVK